MLRQFGCSAIAPRTFYKHQRNFLLPAIFNVWDRYQQVFFSEFASTQNPLILGGDGRADSPGHSAKYGCYTMIALDHNLVLDMQLVQVTISSYHVTECLF